MITVHTSLEDIPFLFQSLTGIEALSSLYTFHVDVLCETQPVDPKKRLGKTLTVASRQAPQVPLRYLSGIMMRVEVKGRNRNNRYDRYTLTVNPALRYLGLGRDYCVLQYPLRWPGPPIVTARVYNQGSMPSWDLSADETQMGLMTRSAGGGAG